MCLLPTEANAPEGTRLTDGKFSLKRFGVPVTSFGTENPCFWEYIWDTRDHGPYVAACVLFFWLSGNYCLLAITSHYLKRRSHSLFQKPLPTVPLTPEGADA